MPVPASSLSVAVQGIAEFLDSQFGEEVTITVAHPQRAAEIARGAGVTAHVLNVFAYRVLPSGFHAGLGVGDPQFIRIHALLTPFPADIEAAADDADLRILGHAIRVLHAHPVLPADPEQPLPGAGITEPEGRRDYRMEAVMLAPGMEEINYIWTTQGADLAYRLSAVYEFSLIPIEPLEPRVVADPPRTVIIDTLPTMAGSGETGLRTLGPDSQGAAVETATPPPPLSWVPVQMFLESETLIGAISVSGSATEAAVVVAGPVGEDAALQVIWRLSDNGTVSQPVQIVPIAAPVLETTAPTVVLSLSVPPSAQSATVQVRPAAGGLPVPDSSLGNTLSIDVT